MSKRLFIAYKLPNSLKNELRLLQYKIKERFNDKSIKWVNPDNMHITIAFLGNVKESSIQEIKNAMNNMSYKETKIKLDTYRFFIRGNIPSVFYISVKDDYQLIDYANKVRAILNSKNIFFDRKEFKSHITIARLKDENVSKEFYEYVNTKLDNIKTDEYTINKIILYESILGNGGVRYLDIYSI